MSRQQNPTRLPHQIDPFRMAEAGSVLHGKIPVQQMRRISELITDTDGDVEVWLQFKVDELRIPCVQGRLQVRLPLICQRCLEALPYVVNQTIELAWIRTELDGERLPIRYETYLVESVPVLLNDVIEEELLLALPQIPAHTPEQCQIKQPTATVTADQKATDKRANPFEVLAEIKRDFKE